MKSRIRKFLRHATTCAERNHNQTGAPKTRARKLPPVTLPTLETAKQITKETRR